MSHKKYADQLLRDNSVTIKYYVGGNHVMYLALFASIIDCDLSMDQNRDDAEKFTYFYQTKCELIRRFETYCHFNKDLLIIRPAPNDKNTINHDLKA